MDNGHSEEKEDGIGALAANIRPYNDVPIVLTGGVNDLRFTLGEGEAWFRDMPELAEAVRKEVAVRRVDFSKLLVSPYVGWLHNDPTSFLLSGNMDLHVFDDRTLHGIHPTYYLGSWNLESGLCHEGGPEARKLLNSFIRRLKDVNALVCLKETFIPEDEDPHDKKVGIIHYSGVPVRYEYRPRTTHCPNMSFGDVAQIFKGRLKKISIEEGFAGNHEDVYARIRGALEREGIRNYWEAICTPEEAYTSFRGMGKDSYDMLRKRLFFGGGLNPGLFPQDMK